MTRLRSLSTWLSLLPAMACTGDAETAAQAAPLVAAQPAPRPAAPVEVAPGGPAPHFCGARASCCSACVAVASPRR